MKSNLKPDLIFKHGRDFVNGSAFGLRHASISVDPEQHEHNCKQKED